MYRLVFVSSSLRGWRLSSWNAPLIDRDCARWQLPSSEVQKRRALFWELFVTDGWQVCCVLGLHCRLHLLSCSPQCLATGRLATFYLPFVDCELPSDPESTIDDDGSVLPSCEWLCPRFEQAYMSCWF